MGGEVHTGFCWGNMMEGTYLEVTAVNGKII
jgi:hypothetical protein